jgi:predicted RNase H-like HicB family nuclease
MSESLRVTIVYESGEDDWIVASIPEVSGVHSQGRTREEARANVIDALRGMLELRFRALDGDSPAPRDRLWARSQDLQGPRNSTADRITLSAQPVSCW